MENENELHVKAANNLMNVNITSERTQSTYRLSQ